MKIKLTESELRTIIQKVIKESEVSDKQRNQPYNTRVSFDDKIYITRNKSTVPPLSQGAVDNAVKYNKITESNEKEITYKGKTITKLFPSGYYEFYCDKEGRFLKFDNFSDVKRVIDDERKNPIKEEYVDADIVVDQFNDFNNIDKKDIRDHIQRKYRNGYYNVFLYNDVLENFLKDNNIKYHLSKTRMFEGKVMSEDTRSDTYKSQIEKEFPEALNNYDGKMSYDEYYLQLSNDKKQQDKVNARELKKQATKDRNEKHKAEFGQRDKEIRKQNIESKKLELIDDFVDFLPENLPDAIEKLMVKYDQGKDSIFYFLIGKYIKEFSIHYEEYEKVSNSLTKLINNDKYEEYLFGKIDGKYGEHIIEW